MKEKEKDGPEKGLKSKEFAMKKGVIHSKYTVQDRKQLAAKAIINKKQ